MTKAFFETISLDDKMVDTLLEVEKFSQTDKKRNIDKKLDLLFKNHQKRVQNRKIKI